MVDPFTNYLNQISRYPLLRPDQEIELTRRVKRLIELEALKRKLTAKEYREMRIGRKAEQQMINSNLKLVVSIARKWSYSCKFLTIDDLIQEGSIGLGLAVRRFDETLGYKFSTYATRWIKQTIGRAKLNQDRTIRLPVGCIEIANRVKKVTSIYKQEHGRLPSREWVASQVGASVQRLENIAIQMVPMCSLDVLAVEDGTVLVELISAPESEVDRGPEETGDLSDLQELLTLTDPIDCQMLKMRYGYHTGKIETLTKVAKHFGVTTTRVKQRLGRATAAMREAASKESS